MAPTEAARLLEQPPRTLSDDIYLLAGLLGTVGLASLVYEPITWLADHDLTELTWSPAFFLSAGLRTIHLSALLAALALTFPRDTNRWFRRQTDREPVPQRWETGSR